MKIVLTLIICFLSLSASAIEVLTYKEVDKLFTDATNPILENYLDTAIPGRCIHKFDPKKISAATMLISFGVKGFEIAPVALRNAPLDYFDNLTMNDVFNLHPEVGAQFLDVVADPDLVGLKLVKKEIIGTNFAEIRENSNYYLMKILRDGRFFRYCYLKKKF